jgi:hypothetical protein
MASLQISRRIKRTAIFALGIFATVYGADYVIFSCCFRANRSLFSTIEINVFYRIPHEGGRIEVSEGDPESQVCVRTIFSHAGHSPCSRVKN